MNSTDYVEQIFTYNLDLLEDKGHLIKVMTITVTSPNTPTGVSLTTSSIMISEQTQVLLNIINIIFKVYCFNFVLFLGGHGHMGMLRHCLGPF